MIKKRKRQSEVDVYQIAPEDWALELPVVREFYALPSLKKCCRKIIFWLKHVMCLYQQLWVQQNKSKQCSALSHCYGFYSAFHQHQFGEYEKEDSNRQS